MKNSPGKLNNVWDGANVPNLWPTLRTGIISRSLRNIRFFPLSNVIICTFNWENAFLWGPKIWESICVDVAKGAEVFAWLQKARNLHLSTVHFKF